MIIEESIVIKSSISSLSYFQVQFFPVPYCKTRLNIKIKDTIPVNFSNPIVMIPTLAYATLVDGLQCDAA